MTFESRFRQSSQRGIMWPNQRTSGNGAVALWFHTQRLSRAVPEFKRLGGTTSTPTNTPSQIMKKHIIIAIACMAAAFTFTGCLHTSRAAAQQDRQLQYTLGVTPEIKRAFHSDDSIKIRSITGTAPKFQTGGTYRVVGTCTQQTLKNATLYLGNTAEAGPDAIVASADRHSLGRFRTGRPSSTLASLCFAPVCSTSPSTTWTTTTRMTMPMRESTLEMWLIIAELKSRMPPSEIIGANAGGRRQLPMRTLRAACVAQFWR